MVNNNNTTTTAKRIAIAIMIAISIVGETARFERTTRPTETITNKETR